MMLNAFFFSKCMSIALALSCVTQKRSVNISSSLTCSKIRHLNQFQKHHECLSRSRLSIVCCLCNFEIVTCFKVCNHDNCYINRTRRRQLKGWRPGMPTCSCVQGNDLHGRLWIWSEEQIDLPDFFCLRWFFVLKTKTKNSHIIFCVLQMKQKHTDLAWHECKKMMANHKSRFSSEFWFWSIKDKPLNSESGNFVGHLWVHNPCDVFHDRAADWPQTLRLCWEEKGTGIVRPWGHTYGMWTITTGGRETELSECRGKVRTKRVGERWSHDKSF